MAEPPAPRPIDPVPLREPIADRVTLILPPVWGRWLEQVRRVQLDHEARLRALEAGLVAVMDRVAALEGP